MLRKRRVSGAGSARYAVALFAVVAIGVLSACDRSADDTRTVEDTGVASVDASTDSEAVAHKPAYGLPLPPDVDRVERTDTMVEVETSLSIDQLKSFYERKLTDYELFRIGEAKLEVVGLRSYMPAIRAHQVGPLTTVTFIPSREPPEPKDAPDAGTKSPQNRAETAPQQRPIESRVLLGPGAGSAGTGPPDREPGTPVEVRTEDGELLAPGAKWGEPYTPPPGSPLHQPRFESNYGLPFGEWHMD